MPLSKHGPGNATQSIPCLYCFNSSRCLGVICQQLQFIKQFWLWSTLLAGKRCRGGTSRRQPSLASVAAVLVSAEGNKFRVSLSMLNGLQHIIIEIIMRLPLKWAGWMRHEAFMEKLEVMVQGWGAGDGGRIAGKRNTLFLFTFFCFFSSWWKCWGTIGWLVQSGKKNSSEGLWCRSMPPLCPPTFY